MSTSVKKIFSILIKAAVVLIAFWVVYFKVIDNENLARFRALIKPINATAVTVTLSFVAALMLVNYSIEALKWQYLTRVLVAQTFFQAIGAVFCGFTVGIFTPNRIGEYGGRVMSLPQRKRIHGLFSMAVGSFSQLVAYDIMGVAAALWFFQKFFSPPIWLFAAAIFAGLLLAALLLVFYFNVSWLVLLLDKIPLLKKYHKFFSIMNRYKTPELFKLILYTLARAVVFNLQYCLIFYLLIPQINILGIVMMVCIHVFVQSLLPSLDILDIGLRNLTAVTLFSYITNQQIAIVAAVSSIWLINLIFPAILGAFFVLKLKFF